jgi:hypothetical protein
VPELTQPIPAKTSGSFASLLASLTGKHPEEPWDDTALADDTATITYEQALRTHRRIRTSEPATEMLPDALLNANPVAVHPTVKNKRKTASITLRLTQAEQAQLQERAAAAQLSVSAYMRSCIFEAESLRAQVKEALAQIQAATQPDAPVHEQPQSDPPGWRIRLLPRWSRHTR